MFVELKTALLAVDMDVTSAMVDQIVPAFTCIVDMSNGEGNLTAPGAFEALIAAFDFKFERAKPKAEHGVYYKEFSNGMELNVVKYGEDAKKDLPNARICNYAWHVDKSFALMTHQLNNPHALRNMMLRGEVT